VLVTEVAAALAFQFAQQMVRHDLAQSLLHLVVAKDPHIHLFQVTVDPQKRRGALDQVNVRGFHLLGAEHECFKIHKCMSVETSRPLQARRLVLEAATGRFNAIFRARTRFIRRPQIGLGKGNRTAP
jgi:hypothetical protein